MNRDLQQKDQEMYDLKHELISLTNADGGSTERQSRMRLIQEESRAGRRSKGTGKRTG